MLQGRGEGREEGGRWGLTDFTLVISMSWGWGGVGGNLVDTIACQAA